MTLQLESSVAREKLRRAVERGNALPRPAEWEGLNDSLAGSPWTSRKTTPYLAIRAGMQLVNRSGPIDQAMMTFCDMMQYFFVIAGLHRLYRIAPMP